MTRKNLLLTIVILVPALGWGQMVISGSGTTPTHFAASNGTTMAVSGSLDNQSTNSNLSNVSLVLKGKGTTNTTGGTLTTVSPLDVGQLTIDAGSNYDYVVSGSWTVLNDLTFTNGKLVIDKASKNNKVTYQGNNDLAGNDASYVIGPIYVSGSDTRTFPVGTSDGYFPARLESIDSAEPGSPLGIEAISGDPEFTKSGTITDIFTGHYWELLISNVTLVKSTTQISLSSNKVVLTGNNDPVILEKDQTGNQKDLGGSDQGAFFVSASPISGSGKRYGLAKGDVATLKVHKLITPDNDGVNDALFINGIDEYPENEVTIIDRWGVPFKTWTNFSSTSAASTDFTKVAIGNYIVVVKYKGKKGQEHIQQMISVLK
jgi:gliding motility-associated-like protein